MAASPFDPLLSIVYFRLFVKSEKSGIVINMKPILTIYWARRDLRLLDNPALSAAVASSKENAVPLLPLFVLEEYMVADNPIHQFGYPQRWFLARALPKFAANFTSFALVRGRAAEYIIKLHQKFTLTIFVNDDVYQDFYTQVQKLKKAGVNVVVCDDTLTVSKETRTGTGNLYSVFTPFKKMVWQQFVTAPSLPVPDLEDVTFANVEELALESRVLIDENSISEQFLESRKVQVGAFVFDLDQYLKKPDLSPWYVSEDEALTHFKTYCSSGQLDDYAGTRDSLERDASGSGATSKMSLALAWGLISPRTLVSTIKKHFDEAFDNPFSLRVSQGALTFISELIWREFYRYQLFHHPELMTTEFQERFRGTIDWVEIDIAKERFLAWVQGETGYSIVDAAMKQIAETGWMHNRARMIVASVLTKNLGVDWRWGQEYFRAALIDLDEASNNGGWQWGASVGADPKPIRIFNPELQAKNHDGSGGYQAKWLSGNGLLRPELLPIVEHKVAREEALKRYGLSKVKPRDF
jgi:deoxyribodipyrimidine photo-lyase